MSERFRGGRPQQPPLPKPYEFVPLPDGRPRLRPPTGHHRYAANSYSGSLSGQIIARSPVHVASGLLEPQPNNHQFPLVKAHFRVAGVVAIPATSLKGCIRSIVEALSRSAVQITRARSLPQDYQPTRRPDRDGVDVAQNIFGALGYQGLVRFGDARLVAGRTITVPTPQLFRPRAESVDTYFDGRRPRGRKFYMHGALAKGDLPLEACEPGSRFDLHADFENLSAGELGLLLIAMGLGDEPEKPRFHPKLGGGKPACLGTIAINTISLSIYDPQTLYHDFDATTRPIDIATLFAAAHSAGLILNDQLDRLVEVLRWPREDRACPDRNY